MPVRSDVASMAVKHPLPAEVQPLALLSRNWRGLVVTDLVYKVLTFALLSPLLSLFLGAVMAIRGNEVLTDVDILNFFAGPAGILVGIALGAIGLGLLALEQASLLAIGAAAQRDLHLKPVASVAWALSRVVDVLLVTARLVVLSLLTIAPFLIIAAGVYLWLLGEHDINFYLNQRPAEFIWAVTIGGLLLAGLIACLLWLYSGWLLALPLVLLGGVSPRHGLQASRQRLTGKQRSVLGWLTLWLLLVLGLNAATTGLIGGLSNWLLPASIGSLTLLAGRVGALLVVLTVSSLVINLLSTISFAMILLSLYLQHAPPDERVPGKKPPIRESELAPPRSWRWAGRWLAAAAIGVLIMLLLGVRAINSVQLEDRTQIMAHRGASYAAPENTLAAVEMAIAAKADWVEIDVQETADGHVVVAHDSDLMKAARTPNKIWEMSLEEIQRIDIGSWFDPAFGDQRVPTLTEVLELCRGQIGVLIELKYYGHDQHLEQRVIDLVEQAGMAESVMIMSLKPGGVAKVKALRPDWKCGLLLSANLGNLQKLDADFVAVNSRLATRKLINQLHRAGKEVFVWTVDEPSFMSTLMSRGVDGLITNRPELTKAVLAERAELGLLERLLVDLADRLRSKPPARLQQTDADA